jgi:ABC-type transporter Mla maintaining outer membrane lipid asymmetry permease subunit MlaE
VGAQAQNPYEPPAERPATFAEPERILHLGAKIVTWSLVVGVAYGLCVAVAQCFQSDDALERFGGLALAPGIVALAAVRVWGCGGAALATSMTTVVVLHRAGRRSTERLAIDARLPGIVALAVVALCPIVIGVGLLGAFLLWRADSGASFHVFVGDIRTHVWPVDLAHGALMTAIYAAALGVGLRVGSRWLLVGRWKLFPKLFGVWVALQGVSLAGYLVRRLL